MQVVAAVPVAGPVPATNQGRYARRYRVIDLLRTDEMNMRVDPSGCQDLAFAGDHLGTGADDDVDPGLNVGISRLADPADPAVGDRDVGLDDAPVVNDQRVGDDGIDRPLRLRGL